MGYHNKHIRIANIKKKTANTGNDSDKLDYSYITSDNVKLYSYSGKPFSTFFTKL